MPARKAKPSAKRTAKGHFVPGHPGGPGRPKREVERSYLEATAAAVSIDDWRDVVAKALTDAKAGDSAARTWLAKLLIGDQPAVVNNITNGPSVQEQIEQFLADERVIEVVTGSTSHAETPGRHTAANGTPRPRVSPETTPGALNDHHERS